MNFMNGMACVMALKGGVRFPQVKLEGIPGGGISMNQYSTVASCKTGMADNSHPLFIVDSMSFAFCFLVFSC